MKSIISFSCYILKKFFLLNGISIKTDLKIFFSYNIVILLFIYSMPLKSLYLMPNNGFESNKIDFSQNSDSFVLTQYSFEASKLIKSFTKNIPFVLIFLILIGSMTTFDLLMDLGFIRILSDEIIDAMIISVSIFLIGFTIFIIKPLFKSQKILERWSNLFENNAIRTGIILTIKDKSKEEILYALSEVIDQIAIPLENYLSKSDKKEFYNVQHADYFGVGAVYATDTKHDAEMGGINLIQTIRSMTDKPLIGIGGINLQNLIPVIQAGCDGIAVISAILNQNDVKHATEALVDKVRETKSIIKKNK